MKTLTPLKAIRTKCLECSGGSATEVKLCEAEDCPLHLYRFGHNPRRAGVGGRPIGEGVEISGKTITQVKVSDEKEVFR